MTEDIKPYVTTSSISIDAFRNRPCSLPANSPDYKQPTPEEVKALRKLIGLSQAGLAKFLGAAYNAKGSNTVRKWETKIDSKEHRPINYAAWRLMLIGARVIDGEEIINNAEQLK